MSLNTLEEIAEYIVSDGKGILAADESNPTCGKRFDSIGVESTESNRRDYREMLFRSSGMKDNIGGVILFDETIRQNAQDGTPLIELIKNQGALPGIKVDKGLAPLDSSPEETITQGLDGLDERCKEYFTLGAKFTKWRAVIKISDDIPTDACIQANMEALARYAKIVQDCGLVPIVEPEVIMDGNHSIDDCYKVTCKTLKSVFSQLELHKVFLGGILLKPNMVISGTLNQDQATVDTVADLTLECLNNCVPKDVPGIVFLSGGQSNKLATEHLNAMNKKANNLPWNLSFSYGRALQQPSLNKWLGKVDNVKAAQEALFQRSKFNSEATQGNYNSENEI